MTATPDDADAALASYGPERDWPEGTSVGEAWERLDRTLARCGEPCSPLLRDNLRALLVVTCGNFGAALQARRAPAAGGACARCTAVDALDGDMAVEVHCIDSGQSNGWEPTTVDVLRGTLAAAVAAALAAGVME